MDMAIYMAIDIISDVRYNDNKCVLNNEQFSD